MLFEKIYPVLDSYHQRRITKYLSRFKINYFIDVGAHKGEFLNHILKIKCKKIFCFEPQKKIFNILHKRYKNNKKVKLFNLGLAEKNSTRMFHISKLTLTSTFSKSKKTFFSKLKNFIINSNDSYVSKQVLETKKTDDIFIDKKIDNVFLKIDVEGFELNVLKGSKKLLKKKVNYVLVEKQFYQLYQNNSPKMVDLFLKKNKFRLLKKFTFPLLHFQDNLYVKEKMNY